MDEPFSAPSKTLFVPTSDPEMVRVITYDGEEALIPLADLLWFGEKLVRGGTKGDAAGPAALSGGGPLS